MIVDTGLHYKGMKRSEAFKMFAEYAWDDSDFTQKEVYISLLIQTVAFINERMNKALET